MLTSALHERLSAIPPPVSPLLLQEKMLNAERKRKERLDKLVMREKAKVKRHLSPTPTSLRMREARRGLSSPITNARAARCPRARIAASAMQHMLRRDAPHVPQLPQQSEVGNFIAPPPTRPIRRCSTRLAHPGQAARTHHPPPRPPTRPPPVP